jgi:tetratricopeptide (TPR) repeat protein
LIARMPKAVRTAPLDAVRIASVAVGIAESLDSRPGASDLVYRLRGAALRELSFARIYVGDLNGATTAAQRAGEALAMCVISDYECGRLAVLDAQIARAADRVTDGLARADEAVRLFNESGESTRLVSAVSVKASILARQLNFHAAIALTEEVLASASSVSDFDSAMLHANLGYYYREVRQFGAALRHLEFAAVLLDDLHMIGDAIRTRWNVAVVLKAAGRIDDAALRLSSVVAEFDSLGMSSASAMAALDLAEVELARDDFAAVEKLCRQAMDKFTHGGFSYSERANTAIALLCEASKRRAVSLNLLRSVVHYVRRLPDNPKLDFAFAPSSSGDGQNFG